MECNIMNLQILECSKAAVGHDNQDSGRLKNLVPDELLMRANRRETVCIVVHDREPYFRLPRLVVYLLRSRTGPPVAENYWFSPTFLGKILRCTWSNHIKMSTKRALRILEFTILLLFSWTTVGLAENVSSSPCMTVVVF